MDKLTKEQRSKCMRAVKGRDTKPEMWVRRYLFAHGFRYRLNVRCLPGKPDIVLKKYKTVVFVNGCFWHGHEDCQLYRLPQTNVDFWKAKIERNRARDLKDEILLRSMGWHVIVIWECELRTKVKRKQTLASLAYTLNHIYLLNHGAKPYADQESSFSIAAEDPTG